MIRPWCGLPQGRGFVVGVVLSLVVAVGVVFLWCSWVVVVVEVRVDVSSCRAW